MNFWSLAFAPMAPLPLLDALAIVAFGLGVGLLWRRRRGAWLRIGAMALLLAGLLDPSLQNEIRRPLKDIVAVVIDRSGSQALAERSAQTDAARAAIAKQLASLDNVETRFIDADAGDRDNQGTRLFAALSSALSDAPPERIGAAIFVTDGIVHDIPASLDALGFHAPLHALITGHEGERDRRIELVEAPRFGLVGKELRIAARVLDMADQGEPVRLEVRRDGEILRTLAAKVGETISIYIPIEHAGPNVVELAVAPLPGELTQINNRAVVTLEGVRDKLRVLLVSGEPHQGERMWRNLLKADANVDLVHFTILRPPDKSTDGTPINELSLIAFPVADLFGPKIKDFDLIIFDRYSSQEILQPYYLANIVDYVRNGGALLMAEGPEFSTSDGLFFSPLGGISPVRPDGEVRQGPFRPSITAQGERHPVTRGLDSANGGAPWGQWFRQVGGAVTSGVNVLAGPENSPLLVLSRVDKGRVGLLLSDQIWLWARGYDGGGPHLDLLRRLAHWLMKEPELEEEALFANAKGGKIEIIRQSMKDDAGEVTITAPDGAVSKAPLAKAEPGRAKAMIEADQFGLYRLSDGAHIAVVNVGPDNPLEYQEVVSTLEKLRPLAEASGGSVRRLASAAEAPIVVPRILAMRPSPYYSGADYIGVKRSGASELIGVTSISLASGFLGLAALLGLVVLAWAREGRA